MSDYLNPVEVFNRYLVALAAAFTITGILLYVMQAAISDREATITPRANLPIVSIVRKIKDVPIELPDKVRVKPPKVEEMPPMPIADQQIGGSPHIGIVITPPPKGRPDVGGGTGIADGDLMPIMTVMPEYPERLLARGIEGWVVIEFIVDKLGRVSEPRVIDASPPNVFDRSALRAVLRYMYKPRVMNGEAQTVHGVRQRIVFDMT